MATTGLPAIERIEDDSVLRGDLALLLEIPLRFRERRFLRSHVSLGCSDLVAPRAELRRA
jgi:hypothetical protein